MTSFELLALIVVFALASMVGVVTGSNSLITVPVMFQVGIDPKVAVATNMFGLTFLNIGAFVPFARKGMIDFRRLNPLVGVTIVASAVGALLVGVIQTEIVPLIVSVSMIVLVLFTLFTPGAKSFQEFTASRSRTAVTFFLTFALGIYGGLYSGGYVTILTVVFASIYGLGFAKSVAGTKYVNIFSSGVATLIFAYQGLIDYRLGLILAITMFVAAYVGAKLVTAINEHWLKRIFLATVVLLAVKTLFDLFYWSG